MALKFLNKKGWHTGSLRNIENVWKAEQKHEAEKRKLEELKKQIHEEREAQEFRHLQEQAGLVPKQERLEFLYDSGLSVGRNSTADDYLLGKPLEENKKEEDVSKVAAAPGALFAEEKPQSANDAWRKLHTDPLLLIRQQEQAAIARIKNNPVKMDLIKKSVQEKIVNKEKRKHKDGKSRKHKEKRRKKHDSGAPSELTDTLLKGDDYERKRGSFEKEPRIDSPVSRGRSPKRKYSSPMRVNGSPLRTHDNARKQRNSPERRSHGSPRRWQDMPTRGNDGRKERHDPPERRRGSPERSPKRRYASPERRHDSPKRRHASPEKRHDKFRNRYDNSDTFDTGRHKELSEEKGDHRKESDIVEKNKQKPKQESRKLTEEEKAARLKAMQNDADAHEEQRWHRLKKASDTDQLEEAKRLLPQSGRNFVDQTAIDIYGAARGGGTSVEESVRRRAHFIERSLGDSNFNTFQRL